MHIRSSHANVHKHTTLLLIVFIFKIIECECTTHHPVGETSIEDLVTECNSMETLQEKDKSYGPNPSYQKP